MKQKKEFLENVEENMNFFQWLGMLTDFAFCQQITGVFIACYRFIYPFWNKK